jgi:hypothetical protein
MDLELWSISHAVRDFFLGASTFLFVTAIAWRLAVRPTVRALLELRAAREGGDGNLARRVVELEEEVRMLKAGLPGRVDPLEEALRSGPFAQRWSREKL